MVSTSAPHSFHKSWMDVKASFGIKNKVPSEAVGSGAHFLHTITCHSMSFSQDEKGKEIQEILHRITANVRLKFAFLQK